MTDFFERFRRLPRDPEPLGLQLLFPSVPELDVAAIRHFLHVHPEMHGAACEFAAAAELPPDAQLVTDDGPAPLAYGLVGWGRHTIQIVLFDGMMPYGPVETCVMPALMPPELKQEAKEHRAHALLYYAGTEPDPFERYVALAAVAGSLAIFDASVILNEEGRTAVPAFDLIPDGQEDLLQTIRKLPIPYLFGGFVKMDVGDPDRPWARTFSCHRLGLPDLARHLTGHEQTAETFHIFSGVLGYLKQSGEALLPGETIDLGDRPPLTLRAPHSSEWYLDSPGPILVLE